jgi:PAS domain-containing protein
LRVYMNRVVRKILGYKREEVRGGWESYIRRGSFIYTCRQILFG